MTSEYSNILSAFESQGLSETDLISEEALRQLLARMNGHEEFDQDVFLEIWDQCEEKALGKRQIRDIVDVVYRARHILSNRVIDCSSTQCNIQKNILNQNIKSKNSSPNLRTRQTQAQKVNQKMKSMMYKKNQEKCKMLLQSQPQISKSLIKQSVFVSPVANRIDIPDIALPEEPLGFDLPIRAKAEQRLLLLFILIGFLLQLLIIDSKIGLLNLLVYFMITVLFVLPIIPKHYWLMSLVLLAASIVLDICWLSIYASTWWWKPSEHSNSLGFQRYSIVMTSILLILKAFMGVLLFIGFKPTKSEARDSRMSSQYV